MRAQKFKDHRSLLSVPLRAKPVLKWAGGKGQLVPALLERAPRSFGKYIEPFFGGGALFFALGPANAVIADSNPELVNLYRSIRDSVDEVLQQLHGHRNVSEAFYATRAIDWTTLSPAGAAARTIYLNRTCFNGLYRVNRKGQFNSPFGRYANPKLIDEANLRTVSAALTNTEIVEGDYLDVLHRSATSGDFIFLDPPYLPISKYADFKRYTKEQFYEEDHVALAAEVRRLQQLGCHVLLTNSNHPLVHELYEGNTLEIFPTRRSISSSSKSRSGEDVVVIARPESRLKVRMVRENLPGQVDAYPTTRYMGSKRKLLRDIWDVASQFRHESVLDLFSGSGVVSYMFKSQGKRVISNDHMASAHAVALAMVANDKVRISREEAEAMLEPKNQADDFVYRTFRSLYFRDADLRLIDSVRSHVKSFRSPAKKAIVRAALIRACIKKRPRGIFTYTGDRYDDGRKDLRISMRDHFLDAVETVCNAVFNNGTQCEARWGDAMDVPAHGIDLVYMDPPYFSKLSDNEYVRRYHFTEGIARDWQGVTIQENTQTKKFRSYPTPFSTRQGAEDAFDRLFRRFKSSVIMVSYSSNSLPSQDEMVTLLARHKSRVEVVPIDHRYSFGNRANSVEPVKNKVSEFLFVGY